MPNSIHCFKLFYKIVSVEFLHFSAVVKRLIEGNKAFYANQNMFQNELLSKKSILKFYWTLIRPIVTYACETWVLKESSIQKLMIGKVIWNTN
jgi:hypothetical protein